MAGVTLEPGVVWLVGAGPGDPGLLTLNAAQALAQADIVLHDALVSPEILAMASQARLEPVGKRAGGRRTPQMRINERLIELARAGHRVVRLKGGDPMVFGRGAEEALALAAAGIRFRIVPGISAGIGAAAAAGIPVTHRGLAHSVAFATGHDTTGELPAIDWTALARGADVLVLYMALRHIGAIAAHLRGAGRDGAEHRGLHHRGHHPPPARRDHHPRERRGHRRCHSTPCADTRHRRPRRRLAGTARIPGYHSASGGRTSCCLKPRRSRRIRSPRSTASSPTPMRSSVPGSAASSPAIRPPTRPSPRPLRRRHAVCP